jgi:flavin-dependent dehydrogenase
MKALPKRYDALIIGGGLAGATAAFHLARSGLEVLVVESGTYPRHKLCGEFLSVEVHDLLAEMGLADRVLQQGARQIRRLRMTTTGTHVFEADLPGTGIGVSRYLLDPILLEAARLRGAEVRTGTEVRSVSGSLDRGFSAETTSGEFRARVVIGAFGRASKLSRQPGKARGGPSPWVAFKAHYSGPDLGDSIELHAFSGGYCGMSAVEGGRTNVCWIAHRRALQRGGGRPEGMISSVLAENRWLASRLESMAREHERFIAVSGLQFSFRDAFQDDVCLVGDAAGMIAPVCGDGMAMAIRSGSMAATHMSDLIRKRISPDGARRSYEYAWRRAFGVRMVLGRMLHSAYVRPRLGEFGVRLAAMIPPAGTVLIGATRG